MTDTTLLFMLGQALRRLDSDSSFARSTIERARTMREVKHAANVHPAPYIRHLPQCRRIVNDVRTAGEAKMEALLADQLRVLANSADVETMRQATGRLAVNEWCFLRGTFSRIYAKAERESGRLLHLARARAQAADEPAADDTPAPG